LLQTDALANLQLTVDALPLPAEKASLSRLGHETLADLHRLDVSRDGILSPLDILTLVHWLNCHADTPETTLASSHLDVSRDGFITPLDILQVVAYLNVNVQISEGEALTNASGSLGEQPVPADASHAVFGDLAACSPAAAVLPMSNSQDVVPVPSVSSPDVFAVRPPEPFADADSEDLATAPGVAARDSATQDQLWLETVDDCEELEDILSDIAEDVTMSWSL
jgi:hypothetical protein